MRPIALALAAGVVASGRRISRHHFDVHTGVKAFGMTAFAREHFVAFHNSPESVLLGFWTHGIFGSLPICPSNVTSVLPPIKEDRRERPPLRRQWKSAVPRPIADSFENVSR